MRHQIPRIYIISDRLIAGGSVAMLEAFRCIAAALPPGAMAVQIREKDLGPRDVVALARHAVESLAPWNVPVLVNDRFDLAVASGAAGVHLSSAGISPGEVRRVYEGIIAISTHSSADLAGLDPNDVDFAVFGPVFDTPSKRSFGPPLGMEAVCKAVDGSPVPILALGGIHPGNAHLLAGIGIAGIAMISAVLCAPDPAHAACVIADAAFPSGDR